MKFFIKAFGSLGFERVGCEANNPKSHLQFHQVVFKEKNWQGTLCKVMSYLSFFNITHLASPYRSWEELSESI